MRGSRSLFTGTYEGSNSLPLRQDPPFPPLPPARAVVSLGRNRTAPRWRGLELERNVARRDLFSNGEKGRSLVSFLRRIVSLCP